MMSTRPIFLWFLVVTSVAWKPSDAQPAPQEVVFQSGPLQLHGFLWKPPGPGPYPAVLWNHGSEKLPGSHPALAKFYTDHSYVFFVPHRRGQGQSPGPYIQDLLSQTPAFERGRRMMQLQEEEVQDVISALRFLKLQTFVDGARISISGCSYGGIQTLLAGELDLGVRALVPFAPGAMSWDRNPVVSGRLSIAVARARVPIFLLQAKNDYSLGPSHVLAKEAIWPRKQSGIIRISHRKSIPLLAGPNRMGIGASVPVQPMFGEVMCCPFWRRE